VDYENIKMFIPSSLYEGFGYTPIEAAMCGCPVISSIQEALPDSTQGLLNYYHPAMDADVLANKILAVLENPPAQETLLRIAETYKKLYAPIRQVEKIQAILFVEELRSKE
jgi:glycosyltransferase involved in cell wall biosynthesis